MTATLTRTTTHVREFDAARVRPLPDQPRKRFRGIKELAESISEVGQATPGIVTLVHDDPAFDAQLVDGERRLRACRSIGKPFRAEVRADPGVEETFVASFAANFGKQDHDLLEVAQGLARMHRGGAGKSIEQLGRIAGKSYCWVAQHLSLLKLHPDVQAMLVASEENEDAPRLAFSTALLLVPVAQDKQLALARKITKGDGMSLAAARRLVLRERSADGETGAYLGERGKGPRRTLATVESILEETSDRIGVYLDMPGSEINRLIDSVDHLEKRKLIEALEETAGDLEALATAIRRRLPVIGQGAGAGRKSA